MPPHMAGRNSERQLIADSINELAYGETPQSILMIGPRGCGKTVLLNWCEQQAMENVENVRLKDFSKNLPSGENALVLELLRSVFDLTNPDEVSAKVNALIGGGESKWNLPKTIARIKELLTEECKKHPLLVTLDEASACEPERLGDLLNLTQTLNSKTGNVLVVIAGTPGVLDVLSKSNATFYDRGNGLDIGLLEDESSKDAIRKPFSESGMSISNKAIDTVVEQSQGYPYFLQEWGKELYNAAQLNGSREVSELDVDNATEKLNAIRDKIYVSRYRDWQEGDIKLLGEVLHKTGSKRKSGQFTSAALRAAVADVLQEHEGSQDRAGSFTRQVMHTGFLWQPLHSVNLIPGLPSFVNHVLERCGYRPDRDNNTGAERQATAGPPVSPGQ